MADGLSLLANTVMAWNTMQMQAVLNRWANRRQVVEADIMAKIAPTRLSGINLRGVFRFVTGIWRRIAALAINRIGTV